MAFWDKVKSTLSDAAELTAKKTGEVSDIAKLKIEDSKLNNEITAIYSEIGKLIYRQYKEQTDETQTIAEKCLAIDEKMKAIAKNQADIGAIKAKSEAEKAQRAQAKAAAKAASAPAQKAPAQAAPAAEEVVETVVSEAEAVVDEVVTEAESSVEEVIAEAKAFCEEADKTGEN